MITSIFLSLLNLSITAGWMILAVIVLRLFLRRVPRKIICLLWAMVAVRLVLPISWESGLSLIPSTETFRRETAEEAVMGDIYGTAAPGTEDPWKEDTGAENYGSNLKEAEILQLHSGFDSLDRATNEYLRRQYETTDGTESVRNWVGDTGEPATGGSRPLLTIVLKLAGYFYLAGVLVMLSLAVLSYLRLRRRVRICLEQGEGVCLCDGIATPFILGIFSPKIYLPSFLGKEEAEYVIAHERAHLKRRDHWWKALGYMLLSLHWMNPLVWIAYALFCKDIELACDEQVIADKDGEYKRAYAGTLLACSMPGTHFAAYPLAFGEVSVKERILSVMNYRKPSFWVVIAGAAACVVVAVCFLTSPKKEEKVLPGADPVDPGVQQTAGKEETHAGENGTWEESSAENKSAMELGDLDGNGIPEYAVIDNAYVVDNCLTGRLTVFWNDEEIYDYVDSNRIAALSHDYLDLDEDGEKELFLAFEPMVNSSPLMEYVVLKRKGEDWEPLEMPHGESMQDNSLPIFVNTDADYHIIISCGKPGKTQKHVTYSVRAYYEALQEDSFYAEYAAAQLERTKDHKGDRFGETSPWGIWEIESCVYQGQNCLRAVQGIEAVTEPFSVPRDFLGELVIYFHYDGEGNLKVLDIVFVPSFREEPSLRKREVLIYSAYADLTQDGKPDLVEVYGEIEETGDTEPALEDVLSMSSLGCYVRVFEGKAQDTFEKKDQAPLYVSRMYHPAHPGNGAMFLARKEGKDYLVAADPTEYQGVGSYELTVFCLSSSADSQEGVLIEDRYRYSFVMGDQENPLWEEGSMTYQEARAAYLEAVAPYLEGSTILLGFRVEDELSLYSTYGEPRSAEAFFEGL